MGIEFFILLLPIIIITIAVHEFSHGYVAYLLGDPTAKESGRLTLNPLAHLDLVGTLVLIITSLSGRPFGWAKPVPINPYYFKNMYKDIAKVGAAGPLSNILFAYMLSGLHRWGLVSSGSGLFQVIELAVMVNLGLALFNLIPVPPLDGSRIIVGFLPENKIPTYLQFERYGFFILIFIVFFAPQLLHLTLVPVWDFLYNLFMQGAVSISI